MSAATVTNLARIVTMSVKLLKELPLEAVLEAHPLLNAQKLPYGLVKKTKPIKARPINTILDKSPQTQSVWDKMLLATLEGSQSLKRDSFVCWGCNDDVWQQTSKKLHDKYFPTETDVDGWVTYWPKDGDDAIEHGSQQQDAPGPYGGFCVINPIWGDERLIPVDILEAVGIDPAIYGATGNAIKLYLHYGVIGDWVLQKRTDALDCYRVAKSFFDSTYEIQ